MTNAKSAVKMQSAVIPARISATGHLEVLIISNKDRTRWLVPKGNVEPGTTPGDSAAREAWEEGGVRGEIMRGKIGGYSFEKNGLTHLVEVFVMVDARLSGKWPEMGRLRRWCAIGDAMELVHSPGLASLLALLPGHLSRMRPCGAPFSFTMAGVGVEAGIT